MTEADSFNALVLKPLTFKLPEGSTKRNRRNLFFFVVLFTELLAIWGIIHPEFVPEPLWFMPWLWALNTPMFFWSLRGVIIPNQGYLILTSEGFEVQNIDAEYRRKYRWTEVTGF